MRASEIVRISLLSLQVCVPANFTDEDIKEFVKSQVEFSDSTPEIVREFPNGDPERVTCGHDKDMVHVVLNY